MQSHASRVTERHCLEAKTANMTSLSDVIDPDSFPHRRVVGCQGHGSNKKTVLVRYLHTCHIHELVWRTGRYVESLPQRIDGNAQTEVVFLHNQEKVPFRTIMTQLMLKTASNVS